MLMYRVNEMLAYTKYQFMLLGLTIVLLTTTLGIGFAFVVDENRRPADLLAMPLYVLLLLLLLIRATDSPPPSLPPRYNNYLESIWEAWSLLADTGIQYYSWKWEERGVAMASTLFGILFFSVVVGFVVDAVRDKMDELKQGKTRVYVENQSTTALLLLLCCRYHYTTTTHAPPPPQVREGPHAPPRVDGPLDLVHSRDRRGQRERGGRGRRGPERARACGDGARAQHNGAAQGAAGNAGGVSQRVGHVCAGPHARIRPQGAVGGHHGAAGRRGQGTFVVGRRCSAKPQNRKTQNPSPPLPYKADARTLRVVLALKVRPRPARLGQPTRNPCPAP